MRSGHLLPLLLLTAAALAQPLPSRQAIAHEPVGLAARVHATRLARIGPRPVGTAAERAAASLVAAELERCGFAVERDGFDYGSFVVEDLELTLDGRPATAVLVGFDPYQGERRLAGTARVLGPEENASPEDLAGRLVLLGDQRRYFECMALGATAAVVVDSSAFAALDGRVETELELLVAGRVERGRSLNVIGRLSAPAGDGQTVWLTAHLDSYPGSPGANDNATGTGAVLELAQRLAARPEDLRSDIVVAVFGGEETGLLGSRACLRAHGAELERCAWLLNVDTVGGEGPLRAETRGGAPPSAGGTLENGFPAHLLDKAWEGPGGRWRIFEPSLLGVLTTACVPDTLAERVRAAAIASGVEWVEAAGLFSDLRTFAQAGVPATGLAQLPGSPLLHTPQDTLDRVNWRQVEAAVRLGLVLALGRVPAELQL